MTPYGMLAKLHPLAHRLTEAERALVESVGVNDAPVSLRDAEKLEQLYMKYCSADSE